MTEQKPVWGRWIVIALVVGVALWAFLGARTKEKPWGLALGQDLRGGTTLRFSLDIEKALNEKAIEVGERDSIVTSTMGLLEKRINRYGLAEVNLTQLGDNRFEISVPADVDADAIQKVVEALGELKFRVEVLDSYPAFQGKHGEVRTREKVWKGVAGKTAEDTFLDTAEGFKAFKEREVARFKDFRDKGEKYVPLDGRFHVVPRYVGENAPMPSKPEEFAVIEESTDPRERLGGEILTNIHATVDFDTGSPAVGFDVKIGSQHDFKEWTTANVGLPMAIVLNGYYDQAPTINSPLEGSVIVTLGGGRGMDFGPGASEARRSMLERQKSLIATLQSGSLRVTPRFEAKSRVGPTLAGEAVRRGLLSIALAFALVLLYMAVYYFFAGIIADVALLLNLLLLVGAMAFLNATLTLPGIAGIVLTLGMAVDANILIYERIREELQRGRSVTQAVAEGFDRAFTTIVDSNVTTLLTALFLFWFGTGAIQGFAVTLALGLIASMFTAVYVTRALIELWIRAGAKTIRMLGAAKAPSIAWTRLRGRFIPASVVVMALSVGLFLVSRDQTVYDIDFTGGMKVQARLTEPSTVDAMKAALDSGPQKVRVPLPHAAAGQAQFKDLVVGPYSGAEVVAVRSEGKWFELRHPLTEIGGGNADGADGADFDEIDAFRGYVETVLHGKLIPSWMVEKPEIFKPKDDADPRKPYEGGLRFKIAIEDPAGVLTVERVKKAFRAMPFYVDEKSTLPASTVVRDIEVVDVGKAGGGDAKQFEVFWKSRRASDSGEVENDGETLKTNLRSFLSGARFKDVLRGDGVSASAAGDVVLADPFPVNDKVGAGVARRSRDDALKALLLSFVAIILYVAFRFRSYAMGFASVLCLVHDVVLALGAVCLADHFGFVDAKINMGLVAAFLTLVGYSVNDTVVTFDRIRELRGKSPKITSKMIDDAINQTLARTIRTSVTVFLTLVVLLAVNLGARSMLEGISYCLLVGVVVGSYSSIGIAAPLLLFLPWFWAKVRHLRPQMRAATWPSTKPWGLALVGVSVAAAAVIGIVRGDFAYGLFFGLIVTPLALTAGLYALWALLFSLYCFIAGCVLVVPWSFHPDPDAAADAAIRATGGGEPPDSDAPPPSETPDASKGGGKKNRGNYDPKPARA